MWPFRRKPTEVEVDLGRKALRESQLAITQHYGWQPSQKAKDQDVLRESLERHEPGLPVADPRPS